MYWSAGDEPFTIFRGNVDNKNFPYHVEMNRNSAKLSHKISRKSTRFLENNPEKLFRRLLRTDMANRILCCHFYYKIKAKIANVNHTSTHINSSLFDDIKSPKITASYLGEII